MISAEAAFNPSGLGVNYSHVHEALKSGRVDVSWHSSSKGTIPRPCLSKAVNLADINMRCNMLTNTFGSQGSEMSGVKTNRRRSPSSGKGVRSTATDGVSRGSVTRTASREPPGEKCQLSRRLSLYSRCTVIHGSHLEVA